MTYQRRFEVGDYVQLSEEGLRRLKRRHPYGWVIAVSNIAVKVKFEDSKHEAEWWELSWFHRVPGHKRIDGVSELKPQR